MKKANKYTRIQILWWWMTPLYSCTNFLVSSLITAQILRCTSKVPTNPLKIFTPTPLKVIEQLTLFCYLRKIVCIFTNTNFFPWQRRVFIKGLIWRHLTTWNVRKDREVRVSLVSHHFASVFWIRVKDISPMKSFITLKNYRYTKIRNSSNKWFKIYKDASFRCLLQVLYVWQNIHCYELRSS